ncbi:MAG: right-handed parallel beta-helix repeat-containing protein, partial [Anaerolineales bacterium]
QTVLEHIILQGLTIQNGRWGIDAQNTRDIYIHHNIIQDVGYGVYNRRSNGWEYNQIVCDNTITGRISWPGSGIPRERGIDLRGDGNVVCYNTVQSFGDCISVQPYTGPSYGNDVYGNDASYCVDDGIEIDYNQANARVWRNRVMNSCKGISLQPIYGGPAYIFRNELFNIEIVPLKMYNYTTGFYVVHNTSVKHSDGHGDKNEMWRNVVFRNNLFLGTRYAFEFLTVADEGFRDLDYNAWGTTRAIGNANAPYFKWDDVSYGTMTDLPPGVEDNGIPAVFGDLVNAALSASWDTAVPPSSRDLRLAAGAPEIDAGVSLPNLNDGFAISGLPDMGAFEYGQPLPQYGPRPATPDLSTSFKRANFPNPALGEVVTFTISIQNTAWPLAETISLTDTIPSGLTYVPGSLTASSGTPDDGAVPTLRWSGFLGSATAVTISYAVTVTETEPRPINNTVTIDAGSAGVFNFSAAILVNGRFVYLPVVVS